MLFKSLTPVAKVGIELANTVVGTGGNNEKRKKGKWTGFKTPVNIEGMEAFVLPARSTGAGRGKQVQRTLQVL
jgi:hypothetical protein